MNRQIRRAGSFLLAVCTALMTALLLIGGCGLTASAEGAYVQSWEDYKADGGATGTWQNVADAIDDVLETSYRLYVGGDQQTAYEAARDTYNYYYETSGFERSVNGYSGSEVSKAELQFRAARKAVKNGESEADIAQEFNELSEILHNQANHLDGIDAAGESGLNLTGEPEETEAAAETQAVSEADAAAETESADASE